MNTFIINMINTLLKRISILFFVFSTLYLTHLNAATVKVDNNFNAGNWSGWTMALTGGKASTTTSPAQGKYSGKLSLTFGKKSNGTSSGNYRAEALVSNARAVFQWHQEYWFSFKFQFDDWAKDKNGETAPFQVHSTPGSWAHKCSLGSAFATAPFVMGTSNDIMQFVTYGGHSRWKAPLQKHKWYTITVRYKAAIDSSGLIQAWLDGKQIVNVTGANQPKYDKCGLVVKPPRLQVGIYKWGWRPGLPPTQSNRRTLIIDSFKLAQGSNGYSTVTSGTPSSSGSSTSDTSSPSTDDTSSPSTSPSNSTSGGGMVAYWPMNSGTRTTPDVSGGHTGTLVNGAKISNRALKLDGVNDYLNVGDIPSPGRAITISAWIWADDLANCKSRDCRIISKAKGLSTQAHDFMISPIKKGSNTRLRARLNINGATLTAIASSGNIQERSWVHVAVVYDGRAVYLYQDGKLVGKKSQKGKLTFRNKAPTWIGGNPSSATARPWKGFIDEVAIYGRALSGSEIKRLAK